MKITGTVRHEPWRMVQPFVIAGHAYEFADVVVVELEAGGYGGRGEATPTAYFGETMDSVIASIRQMLAQLEQGVAWKFVHDASPPGAARNAVDCAIWDLGCKTDGQRIWDRLALPMPKPVMTAKTLSFGAPEAMAAEAAASEHRLLKLKLGDADDRRRVEAVRRAAPEARLIVDANQAWDASHLLEMMPVLRDAGVEMLEQPLPPADDEALASIDHAVPIGADESCHTSADLVRLVGRYDVVNLKLDKTGGLTEGLAFAMQAQRLGLRLMVGCMEGTSLAMAPGTLLAGMADFVDLDGPLLIGADRPHGLVYERGWVHPPKPELWG